MFNLSLLSFALLIGATVHAQSDVPYVAMKLCDSRPFATVRDFWDHAGKFCFETNNLRHEWPIADMAEVTLRHDGQWLPGRFVAALSEENRGVVSGYRHYSVRYLAIGGNSADASQPFVAQVYYNLGPATLTTYAFGEIGALGGVRLTGFSDAGTGVTGVRSTLKTLKHTFELLRGRNPNRVAVDEMKNQERRRIRPSEDVIRAQRALTSSTTKP